MAEATKDEGVTGQQAVTPNGMGIIFQWEPKRSYRVRSGPVAKDQEHLAPLLQDGWSEVPSVTEVLDVLDKKGLPWWGMKVGVEGAIKLHNTGKLRPAVMPDAAYPLLAIQGDMEQLVVATTENVIDLLTANKLTVNHVRDQAGERGRAVHDALELWAKNGTMPDPAMFPPEEAGYVIGLVQFLNDTKAIPHACEVMVGSIKHGYAGRYDVRLEIPEECQVVFHRTPVRGPQYAILSPGHLLADLKTSKGVYPSHSRQLEAYEEASVECGYDPTDARGILHVGADGTYEFVRSSAVFEDFRVVLDVWKSDQAMKERKKR